MTCGQKMVAAFSLKTRKRKEKMAQTLMKKKTRKVRFSGARKKKERRRKRKLKRPW